MSDETKQETETTTRKPEPSATAARPKAGAAGVGPNYDEITYIPGPQDPPTVKWNGIEFRANVPVKVSRTQTILTPLPIRTPMRDDSGKQLRDPDTGELMFHNGVIQPDGTLQTRHVEQKVPMYKLAEKNPSFSVNGAPPAAKVEGHARGPSDPETYRGYALRWIPQAMTARELETRWEAEAALRKNCGVDDKDVGFLMPFYEARREMLKDAA
jgi:hypothetical protein